MLSFQASAFLLLCIVGLFYSLFKMPDNAQRRSILIGSTSMIILYGFYFLILFCTGKL